MVSILNLNVGEDMHLYIANFMREEFYERVLVILPL